MGKISQADEKELKIREAIDKDNAVAKQLIYIFLALGFLTRFYLIWYPPQVVFDEVHFGKFAGFYIKKTFFFDVHPPLAKLLLALAGWLVGYNGHFEFKEIGMNYFDHLVPFIPLRSMSAIFGALLCPLVFMICKNIGLSNWSSSLAAVFVTFENSLVCVSRLIMLDSQLIFNITFTMFSYVKFMQNKLNPFTKSWWIWLSITGASLALTLGVKMVGLFTIGTVGITVAFDLWKIIDINRGLTQKAINKHILSRVYCLIFLPMAIYLSIFYVHFKILDTSGPGDSFMSSDFQATLKGNNLYKNSVSINYDDIVHFKHKESKSFLNSHNLKYPLRYPDGRISTAGQQVTSTKEKGNSTRWKIIVPVYQFEQNTERVENRSDSHIDNSATNESVKNLKNGDIIQLLHVDTDSIMLTHDVASPMMPTNEEITTINKTEVSKRYNDTLFKIVVENSKQNDAIKSLMHEFKILHVETNVAVWVSNNKLPEWGLGQNEVNGNKRVGDVSNLWVIGAVEHKNISELPAKEPRKMGFLKKFFELQYTMIDKNNKISSSHPFSTRPHQWILLLRGTSYWTNEKESRQIYILGNPVGWLLSSLIIIVSVGLMLSELYLKRRGVFILEKEKQKRLESFGYFLTFGYLMHYVPFYFMGRQLFLHHYFPALVMKYIFSSGAIHYLTHRTVDNVVRAPIYNEKTNSLIGRDIKNFSSTTRLPCPTSRKTKLVLSAIMTVHILVFIYFSPLTYGFPSLNVRGVKSRKWLSSWDFSFSK